MSGFMIEFSANGHTSAGYLAKPKTGSGPGLLVIQEWWGLVDHIKDIADRFASAGFVALAPDLYHGERTTNPDEAGRRLMALDIARAGQDLVGAAKYLQGLDAVDPKKVAAVGYCMGGQLALFAATEHPEIAAAVNYYGVHPNVNPDYAKLGGPVQCHFGKTDGFVDQDTAHALVAKLKAAGADVEAHHYEAGHAFFNDARPEAYDEAAAKLSWERTLKFLRAHLS